MNTRDTNVKLASAADMDRIRQFNETEKEFPKHLTLHQWIEEQIDPEGSDTAVICDHDKAFNTPALTWAQLNEKTNQLACLLRANGVHAQSVVGIMV